MTPLATPSARFRPQTHSINRPRMPLTRKRACAALSTSPAAAGGEKEVATSSSNDPNVSSSHPAVSIEGMGDVCDCTSEHAEESKESKDAHVTIGDLYDDRDWVEMDPITLGDEHFVEQTWEPFISAVTSVGGHFPKTYPWDQLSDTNKAQLSSWVSNPKRYIEGNGTGSGRCFFAACVHHFLYDNLFSIQCLEKWRGEDWFLFGKVQATLRSGVDHEDDFAVFYHNARHLHAGYLLQHWGPHTDIRKLGELFHQQFDFLLVHGPYGMAKTREAVARMIKKAAQVDLRLLGAQRDMTMQLWDRASGKVKDFPFKLEEGSRIDRRKRNQLKSIEGRMVDYISAPRIQFWGIKMIAEQEQLPEWADVDIHGCGDFINSLGSFYHLPGNRNVEPEEPLAVIVSPSEEVA
ncbi:hypothetical protein HJFPF1_08214 [Paramyrothecium foliicola]|nr:hypothetical protein HJFPF1_08214 [Paramyrothecium foliicola]